jgi:hypothetical protein
VLKLKKRSRFPAEVKSRGTLRQDCARGYFL